MLVVIKNINIGIGSDNLFITTIALCVLCSLSTKYKDIIIIYLFIKFFCQHFTVKHSVSHR